MLDPSSYERFQPLPLSADSPERIKPVLRLNSLGSLFYFTSVTLRRKALTQSLHKPICDYFEKEHIKDVFEIPRDHFKSTICSEALPMWRALPFTNQDEDEFKKLGYSDRFIAYMKRMHDPDIRCLLISENVTNAAKLGMRTRWHFESNSLYRDTFPETLPTTSETWTNTSLHVRRNKKTTGGAHGEGTFDFIGVGSALQSRHYSLGIQDDLVGRRSRDSSVEMDKTIDYHRLLVGAFENEDASHENDELVIGNRWGYADLNSWIRENEDWFTIHSHGALGGCCPLHPPGIPIFPERFSIGKLEKIRKRLGAYHYSCQFLNNPSSPEDSDFQEAWLRYYMLDRTPCPCPPYQCICIDKLQKAILRYEVYEGIVKRDTPRSDLRIAIVSDPAHAGNSGSRRCRHAITVLGLSSTDDFILLDSWAMATSYDNYIGQLFKMAAKWNLTKVGLETVAAQKFLKYHIEYRNRIEGRRMTIIDLKGEVEAPDGGLTKKKEWRIRNVLSPIFEEGRFFIQRKHEQFKEEYITFPHGRYVDILDCLAYAPQLLRHQMSKRQNTAWWHANNVGAQKVNAHYSLPN